MLIFCLKCTACLSLLLLFYKAVLEQQRMHVFKRFYLLAALGISFIIPSITFTEIVLITPKAYDFPLHILPQDAIPLSEEKINLWPILVWNVYGIGVAIFLLKFSLNLYAIHHKINCNPSYTIGRFQHVLLEHFVTPHTFFFILFFSKKEYLKNKIPQEVIWHEEAHAIQKHSIDVLCIELLQIMFWCNPIIYLYKKSIKLNHEFLADQAVLQKGVYSSQYQKILLAFSSSTHQGEGSQISLANAINYSSIKKRFTIMKTKTSKKAMVLRSLLALPMLLLLLYGFSAREIIEVEKPSTFQEKSITPKTGASPSMLQEYITFMEAYETSTKKIINEDQFTRIVAIYDLMTTEQKKLVKKYPESPFVNLPNTQKKIPSKEMYSTWKIKENHALWIDGVHVDNSLLDNYEPKDFSYYSTSFVYTNARSDKFPQENQTHLYTRKGYEETFLQAHINSYNNLLKKYNIAIKEFTKTGKQDHGELRILKTRLDKIYSYISEQSKNKYNLKPAAPLPAQKQNLKASLPQIKQYNTIARRYNAIQISERRIKKEELKILEHIYSLMTADQKKKAEVFPECPPTPKQQKASKEQVATYHTLAKKYNHMLKQKDIRIQKSEVNLMEKIYQLMTPEQKKSAP